MSPSSTAGGVGCSRTASPTILPERRRRSSRIQRSSGRLGSTSSRARSGRSGPPGCGVFAHEWRPRGPCEAARQAARSSLSHVCAVVCCRGGGSGGCRRSRESEEGRCLGHVGRGASPGTHRRGGDSPSAHPHADERGTIREIYDLRWGFTDDPLVYVYHVTIRPGQVKGWVVHLKQNDRLFAVLGGASDRPVRRANRV